MDTFLQRGCRLEDTVWTLFLFLRQSLGKIVVQQNSNSSKWKLAKKWVMTHFDKLLFAKILYYFLFFLLSIARPNQTLLCSNLN